MRTGRLLSAFRSCVIIPASGYFEALGRYFKTAHQDLNLVQYSTRNPMRNLHFYFVFTYVLREKSYFNVSWHEVGTAGSPGTSLITCQRIMYLLFLGFGVVYMCMYIYKVHMMANITYFFALCPPKLRLLNKKILPIAHTLTDF